MALKTAASHVWPDPIKAIGNGWIKLVCRCVDLDNAWYQGYALELEDDGQFIEYTTAQPDYNPNVVVAEDIADGDLYFLGKMKGPEILHNQKLATALQIGTAVYKTAAGTWTVADKDTAASLLGNVGIVCGPADRITATVLCNIDTAITATEPADICT